MEAFFKAASSLNDVEGHITSSVHPGIRSFEGVLEAKLISKAKEKASRLAQLSGKKLGPVIFISELTESEMGSLKSFLENLLKMDGMGRKSAFFEPFPDKVNLNRSLRIRFSLQ